MIWVSEESSLRPSFSTRVSHLSEFIRSACGQAVLGTRENVDDLAVAVDLWLRHQDVHWVETPHLVGLVASALSAVGEAQTARRLFVFGSGLVQSAAWEVAPQGATWTLDLRPFTRHAGVLLELSFFPALKIVLQSLGELWDETGGRGTLGLKYVCGAAYALLGEKAPDAIRGLADEIVASCRAALAEMGRQRQWHEVPRVLNLDWC